MKRNEWRDAQGITEKEMRWLELILKMFNGKIVKIKDIKKENI